MTNLHHFPEDLHLNSVFDLDSFQPHRPHDANAQCPAPVPDRGQSNGRTKRNNGVHGQRRTKYITRACQDCQRRKVKCSGEDVCRHCRARNVQCVYFPRNENERWRKRSRADSPASQHQDDDQTISQNVESRDSSSDKNTKLSLEQRLTQLQNEIKLFTQGSQQTQPPPKLDTPAFMSRARRSTFSSTVSYTLDLSPEGDEDTDTFDNGTRCNNLSLSAQIAVLQKLSTTTLGVSRPRPSKFRPERVYSLELPRPSRLRYLLDVHFREIGSYFPFLDQTITEARIFRALETLGYSEFDLIIDVDTPNHTIMALLCNILVFGECHDPEVTDSSDMRPGWRMYNSGRRLLQHCGSSRITDKDLVSYHVLSALYMMHLEQLQSASHAISTAAQLAIVARLNDQTLWNDCDTEERLARQRLWWTIYILDRRISQRHGTPYLIRDSEVAVDDFDAQSVALKSTNQMNASDEHHNSAGSTDQKSLHITYINRYIQVLVNLSRLWGFIWDTFYAASAPKRGDWKEVALTDTRILIIRRELPPELTWDTQEVHNYVTAGEIEPQTRRRLSVFIRINLLRMIIRQNPILSCEGDVEARRFCAHIAKHSIDGIAAYASACSVPRSSGYFISTALVECIFHLVYILQDQPQQIDREDAITAFRKAYELLRNFASIWITAKRALHALSSAIFSGGDANALIGALSRPAGDHHDRIEDSPPEQVIEPQALQPETTQSRQELPYMMHFDFDPLSMNAHQLLDMSQYSLPQAVENQYHSKDARTLGFVSDVANNYGSLSFEQMLFPKT